MVNWYNKRYNLPHLFDAMMDAVPRKRKWVVASRKALADFLELVHPQLLPPEKRRERLQNQHSRPSKMSLSDIVANMPREEFAKLSSNKADFEQWLKEQGL